jgi:outer membrane protein assembly factor BamA
MPRQEPWTGLQTRIRCVCMVSVGLLGCYSAAHADDIDVSGECAEWDLAANASSGQERPDVLDANGFVIGSVLVEPGNIFDLENPKENKFLYRMANKLHIETREDVIEQQLLFAEGEEFSKRLVDESARLLRDNRYLKDASVELLPTDDCVVDVKVHTVDTWTLTPKLTFSRSGGKNSTDVGVKEMNLLGTGIFLEALYTTDVDRKSKLLKYVDRNVGDSWYDLKLLYENSDDGFSRGIDFGKPFFALDATDSHGFSYYDNDRIDSYYDLGDVVGEFRHQTKAYEVYLGRSTGVVDDWVRRVTVGLAYDSHQFSASDSLEFPGSPVPEDRQLFYPFVGIEWLQNDFDTTTNTDQIGRTEDRFLGTRFTARLGRSRTQLGSDRDAWLLNAGAETSFAKTDTRRVTVDGSVATRIESGGLQDFVLEGTVKYYRRQSEKRLFFASASGLYGRELDADRMMELGGDTGLRGYPLRYQAGDKRALFSVEQRFYTNWYPFRLFYVGAAAFFDVGRTWGAGGADTTNLGWLKDAGVGLRLGNSRSGQGGVIHIDLAFPLDGTDDIDSVQFLVSTRKSF